jgi:regulatory protein
MKLCVLKKQTSSGNGVGISLNLIRKGALHLLGRREYSQAELQKKLLEKFPQEASFVQEIINEFTQLHWISDQRYIEEFVREKIQYRGWGPVKISQKLKEKGIESESIKNSIALFFPEETRLMLAKRLAHEKLKGLSKKTAPERKAAVQRFLISRGFDFRTVLEATKFSLNSEGEDLPEDPTSLIDSKIQ